MAAFIQTLEHIIAQRQAENSDTSYTAGLLHAGLDRILKKVGEEAGEVIIAAKNDDPTELKHEVADLLFHLLVLLRQKNISLAAIDTVLEKRHRPQ